MSDDQRPKSGNNNISKEEESLDGKQPNLFQINEIMDKKSKEDMNTLLKKRKKSESPEEIFDSKKKKITDGYNQVPKEFDKKNCKISRSYDNENSKKQDFIIPKSMNLNPEIYNIILNGNELMKNMLEKESLDNKQRKDFNELISEIKKTGYCKSNKRR